MLFPIVINGLYKNNHILHYGKAKKKTSPHLFVIDKKIVFDIKKEDMKADTQKCLFESLKNLSIDPPEDFFLKIMKAINAV